MKRAIIVADAKADQARRAGQPDDASRLGVRALDDLLRGVGFDQHRLAVCVVVLTDFGDDEAPRGALDQAHAETLLEQRDAPAQLRLRHAQCAPGRREAAVIDHLGESNRGR